MTMLLQDAIILGDTLKKCDPGEWLTSDGSCGCAFGGALLAAGVTAQEFTQQSTTPTGCLTIKSFPDLPCIKSRWPWLTEDHLDEISSLYFQVADGHKTIEDVAAYVRSVEPLPTQAQSTTSILDSEEERVLQVGQRL